MSYFYIAEDRGTLGGYYYEVCDQATGSCSHAAPQAVWHKVYKFPRSYGSANALTQVRAYYAGFTSTVGTALIGTLAIQGTGL